MTLAPQRSYKKMVTTQPNNTVHNPNPKPHAVVDCRLAEAIAWMTPFFLISVLCHMMPAAAGGGGGGRDFNYRIPPSWSPEHDSIYSFRAYMTDVSIWVMLADLQPHRQAAAIVMRLGGSAREMARMITPQELTFGGIRSGVQVDPSHTYWLGSMHDLQHWRKSHDSHA